MSSPLHHRQSPDLDEVSAAWLVRARWLAYPAMAAVTAASTHELRLVLRVEFLVGLLAFALGLNVVAHLALQRRWVRPRRVTEVTLLCDSLMVTALVLGTNSQSSPVLLAFLFPPVVAAACLPRRATWTLAALALAGILGTAKVRAPAFFDHSHHHASAGAGHTHDFTNVSPFPDSHLWSHVQGAWLSLVLFGLLLVMMLRSAVTRHQAELARLQSEAAHHKQVAEVASVAANVAHALGTPLSTVVLLADDLARDVAQHGGHETWQRNLEAINEQLRRCRSLLQSGAAGASNARQEPFRAVRLMSLVNEAKERTQRPELVDVCLSAEQQQFVNWLPVQSTVQLLTVILENALQAAPGQNVMVEAAPVEADPTARHWELHVVDSGPGLPPDVAESLGRSPMTTKPNGMGIGLFLGKALLDRLGGSLEFASAASGRGTRATLRLPLFEREPQAASPATQPALSVLQEART